jgi:hypothetical protein
MGGLRESFSRHFSAQDNRLGLHVCHYKLSLVIFVGLLHVTADPVVVLAGDLPLSLRQMLAESRVKV